MTTPTPEPDPAGAPMQRKGRRCGWEGKDRFDFGARRLRVALTELARDPDPAARLAGVRISAEVAEVLHQVATRAGNATTKARRAREKADRLLRTTEERLRQVQAGPTGTNQERNPR